MSILPKHKYGSCSCGCGGVDVAGRKVGKTFYCLDSYSRMKAQEQVAKANQRNAVRGLGTYQKQEGIVDSIQELTIDLDRVISRYVRLRDMEADEKIRCYCCGKKVPYQKAQAMHFIPRSNMGTRFLLENVKSGCADCNVTKRGNMAVYEENLNKEKSGMVDWLREQSLQVANVTRDELKQMLIGFQQKLKLVESKLIKK